MREICSSVAVVLGLLLWTAPAFPQATAWERAIAAGTTAYQQGRLAEAEHHFAAALAEAEAFSAPDLRVARSLDNLAGVYSAEGRYAHAQQEARRGGLLAAAAGARLHP